MKYLISLGALYFTVQCARSILEGYPLFWVPGIIFAGITIGVLFLKSDPE